MSLTTVFRTALGRKGFGCRRDPVDGRDRLVAALRLPETPLDAVNYEHLVPQRLDQGASNSCAGNSWASALQLDRILDGDTAAPLPARRAFYTWARNYDGPVITDGGTYLRSVGRAAMHFGIPPERTCPFDLRLINKPVPWAAYRAAHDSRGVQGYYRISSGDLDGIRRALSAKKPVVFGMLVSRDFTASRGPGTIDADSSGVAGGHAMAVIGYDKERFRILNSWGAGWRENGCAWLTTRLMSTAFDLWVADFQGIA